MSLAILLQRIFCRDFSKIVKKERMQCCYNEKKEYCLSISDASIATPFRMSLELILVAEQFEGISNELRKAEAIYSWVVENVKYGSNKKYLAADETMKAGRGVCAEEAVLYITLARCCRLKANYASVKVDSDGKKVCHACAAVFPDGKEILVDPAYFRFGIMHKEYEIISDRQVLERFEQWNK